MSELERYDEALITINKILSITPNDIEIIHTKGQILLKLKRYDDAIHYFDMVLEIDPTHCESLEDKQIAINLLK